MHTTTASLAPASRPIARQATLGLAAVGIGLLALADNLQLTDLRLLHTFWPMALVLLGLGKLFGSRHGGLRIGGLALVIVGSLLTAGHLGMLPALHLRQWWPLLPIGAGVLLLLRTWHAQR